jgi:hypothetical protein
MNDLEKLSITELKAYKDLLEIRIGELGRYQKDDTYYPPYTDKEIRETKLAEDQAIHALSLVNGVLRNKLDYFIETIH